MTFLRGPTSDGDQVFVVVGRATLEWQEIRSVDSMSLASRYIVM